MAAKNVWEHKNEEYRADSVRFLKKYFPIGSEVTLSVAHVSRSGMRRTIKVMAYNKDRKEIVNVSQHVARVLGWKIDDDRNGVVVDGTGMDMGFHMVYSLGSTLYRGSKSKRLHNGEAGYALTHNYV